MNTLKAYGSVAEHQREHGPLYACKQRLWSEVIYAYCSFPVTKCIWLALSYPHLSSPLSLSLLIFVEAEGDVSLSCEG